MTFEFPSRKVIPQLLSLWKAVFGDHSGFWELFLETGFQEDHCRLILEKGQIAAALCWLDGTCDGQKIAYIYAVVTHPDFRGRGLCRALLADVHHHLTLAGYAMAMLVPESDALRQMYTRLGYETVTRISEFSVSPAPPAVPVQAIGPEAYASARRRFLPEGSVLQEGPSLTFLARQAQFYQGSGFLLAAWQEGSVLHGMELLGKPGSAPGIVQALGCTEGYFRCPGEGIPFAMAHILAEPVILPNYFGFAFD